MVKKALVIGANGQLGSELRSMKDPLPGWEFLFTDIAASEGIQPLDALDPAALQTAAAGVSAIINCAAYTAVDKAEADPETAHRLNADLPALLAATAKRQNAALIHISTDYVFNGEATRPLKEEDPTAPTTVYGATKLEGERAVLASGCRGVILRTAWLYGRYGNNFLKTMLRLGKERESIGVVADQRGTPTWSLDLAQAILQILPQIAGETQPADCSAAQPARPATPQLDGQPATPLPSAAAPAAPPPAEIFHFSDAGECTWFDFAARIMSLARLCCRVNPLTTAQYPTPATRPAYSVLDKSRIKSRFGIQIPAWEDSLKACLDSMSRDGLL